MRIVRKGLLGISNRVGDFSKSGWGSVVQPYTQELQELVWSKLPVNEFQRQDLLKDLMTEMHHLPMESNEDLEMTSQVIKKRKRTIEQSESPNHICVEDLITSRNLFFLGGELRRFMKGSMVTQQSQRLFLFGIVCSTASGKCTMISHKFSVSQDVLQ